MERSCIVYASVPFLISWMIHSTVSTVCLRTLHTPTTLIVRMVKLSQCHAVNVPV